MKTKFITLAALFWRLLATAQTADDYIVQGQSHLGPTADNLWAANTNFAKAIALSPTNQKANALFAITRLLVLPQTPAGSNFLNHLGVPAAGRDLFNWTAQPPQDVNGDPVFPANYNSATAIAFLRTNILATIAASATNLAAITDPNFTLFLPAAQTTGIQDVTVDYGDIQLLRAMLAAGQFFGYTLNAHNFNVVIPAVQKMSQNGTLTIQSLISTYPSLLTLSTPADLANSRSALTNAIALYLAASDFIRNVRASGAVRLFNLEAGELAQEAQFRSDLPNMLAALTGPAVIDPSMAFSINASNYFSGAHSLRSLLPQFAGNLYVNSSLPDYGFGGILVGEPSYLTEEALRKQFYSYAGIYTGINGQIYNYGSSAVSDSQGYNNGSFAIIVRTNQQVTLMGHDDGDGTGNNSFGLFANFTVDKHGYWQFDSGDVFGFGNFGKDGSFYGELDYMNGVSVYLSASRQPPLGTFQNSAGYFSGTFTGSQSGKFYGILSADGELFYAPVQSGNQAGGGGPAQLNSGNQFTYTESGGALLNGTLNNSTLVISGTWNGGGNGTFSMSRSAKVPFDSPPSITAPLPPVQSVPLGVATNLFLNVAGSPPLYFQWYSNGVAIANANASSLPFPNIQYANAGIYSETVANVAGETNATISLVVTPENIPPTNRITAPLAGQRWSNGVFNVTGKAGDNAAVSNVFYSLNNSDWMTASNLNNWANWTAAVNLVPGTNTIAAYAVDTSGNLSTTSSVKFVYIESTTLTVSTNGKGTITPAYNNALLQIGASYAMTAKPAIGFLFANWTDADGMLVTNGATLKFVMASNLTFTANFSDITKPMVSITAPTANQKWSNSLFTVTGKSGDNVSVSNVLYSLNATSWMKATLLNQGSNWTAQVTLTPGTNKISAVAVDHAGNRSLTNKVQMFYVLSDVLTVLTNGKGSITPAYNGARLQIGSTYAMSAKPATGSGFKNWTDGVGTALTNSTTLKFMMASNLTFVANFTDIAKPTVSFTAPTAGQKWSNVLFSVAGKSGDNIAVTNVLVSLNSGDWTPAVLSNHGSNWTLQVSLLSGTNTLAAYAVDTNGLQSTVALASVIRVPVPTTLVIYTNSTFHNPQAQIAFDGTNYLVAFQTRESDSGTPSAQLVSPDGNLAAPLLKIPVVGGADPPQVAFDGTNYLVAWSDPNNNVEGPGIHGQFVDTTGAAIGDRFAINQTSSINNFGTMVFGSGVYFMLWSDIRESATNGGFDSIYGALAGTDGALTVSDFQISPVGSQELAGKGTAAFDGTNFLATWAGGAGHASVNGRLISPAGTFVTDSFLIYTNNTLPAGNILHTVLFDGTKYLALFTVGVGSGSATSWHMLGRFITTSGQVLTNRISITTDAGPQIVPSAAFDGSHYLITWNQGLNPFTASTGTIKARFFDVNGNPTSAEFNLFTNATGQTALWAPVLFDGTRYFSTAGFGRLLSSAPNLVFTNGVIKGAFLNP